MSNITTLKNGVRVVTQEVVGSSMISFGAFVKVGSRYESVDLNGISHFFEHMAFKGTNKRTSREISYAIENVGGYMNAFTGQEMTGYYIKSLAEHIELAADVVSDSLINSQFDQHELDTERGVIIQEINRSLDNPMGMCFRNLNNVLYPDQPMGRSILGPIDNINKFTRDDFFNYLGTHYTADRIVIAASGKLDHATVVEIAEKYFGSIKSGNNQKYEPAKYVGGYTHFNRDYEQVNLAIGWPGNGINDRKLADIESIYSAYIGGGMSSPLFNEVREKRGLVYSVGFDHQSSEDVGEQYLYAGTSSEHVEELIKVALGEVEKSVNYIDPSHLIRAKNQIKVQLLAGSESVNGTMNKIADDILMSGEVETIEESIKIIDSITAEDLRSVAKNLLESKASLSIVGEIDDKDYYSLLN